MGAFYYKCLIGATELHTPDTVVILRANECLYVVMRLADLLPYSGISHAAYVLRSI